MAQDNRLQDRPPIAQGRSPDGLWELRARHEPDASGLGALRLQVDFLRDGGRRIGGFGCSGIGLASDSRPVVLSLSGDKPEGSYCYVGQTIPAARRVVLDLSNGTTEDATVIRGDLPINLWIAFTDEQTTAIEVRAFSSDDLLGSEPIHEQDPRPKRTSTVWGPIDD